MRLVELQALVIEAITARDPRAMAGMLRPDTVDGVSIYQDSYFVRGLEALSGVFPNCRLLTGTEIFSELAVPFLSGVPSRWAAIDALGSRFVEILAQAGSTRGREDLGAVARLEWAMHHAVPAVPVEWLELEYDAAHVVAQLSVDQPAPVSPRGRYLVAVGADDSGARCSGVPFQIAPTILKGPPFDLPTQRWLLVHPWIVPQ